MWLNIAKIAEKYPVKVHLGKNLKYQNKLKKIQLPVPNFNKLSLHDWYCRIPGTHFNNTRKFKWNQMIKTNPELQQYIQENFQENNFILTTVMFNNIHYVIQYPDNIIVNVIIQA